MAYGESAEPVLRDVDFSLTKGERCMLLGPSGCGKSTLLRAVGGFHAPAAGHISLGGVEVVRPGPDRAFVFQEFDQLLPWKRVLANVAYPLTINGHRKADASERARSYLSMMGLDAATEKFPHQLSGGMKQRVAIARAMALEPKVLLMDEPFGALDAQTRSRLQEQFREVTSALGTTVIFVTHSIHEAAFLGDTVIVLGGKPARVIGRVPIERVDGRNENQQQVEARLQELLTDAHEDGGSTP
ncbi:ABC transporter ATP-binding protein [Prauserella cavernicola]|uniref:ABC transporter ATP-binding protein n=1 Tax=Prauserella cavernicola TaxID=2800127 RepID=A0A934R125_9PSEU|nr:ABC transporter ATP-binding protein [Prauserella cavernicola]MBK1789139.1 ABC transporter ATP-binding protein [Prauserella cavernicola]